MVTGNDDWLLGQPNNLEEAADTVIDFYGKDYLMEVLHNGIDPQDNPPVSHIGKFLCNQWFLWWHPNNKNACFPTGKPPLLSFFHDGITYPEDMTDTIFSYILHHFRNIPFDFPWIVRGLQTYWRDRGYPDGMPDVHSL